MPPYNDFSTTISSNDTGKSARHEHLKIGTDIALYVKEDSSSKLCDHLRGSAARAPIASESQPPL